MVREPRLIPRQWKRDQTYEQIAIAFDHRKTASSFPGGPCVTVSSSSHFVPALMNPNLTAEVNADDHSDAGTRQEHVDLGSADRQLAP